MMKLNKKSLLKSKGSMCLNYFLTRKASLPLCD